MAVCKSCGAEIVWIKTKAGKSMPCNADKIRFVASENGGSTIVTASGEVVKGIIVSGILKIDEEEKGFISHFATCPNANNHRRKKK